jgi:hypothetical protein
MNMMQNKREKKTLKMYHLSHNPAITNIKVTDKFKCEYISNNEEGQKVFTLLESEYYKQTSKKY